MTSMRSNITFSIILFMLITAAAWPVFVAVSAALSLWVGEGSVLDAFVEEPKRLLLANFLIGYRSSLIVTIPLGILAVVDYQLFSHHRLTWIIAGFSLLVACLGIDFYFFRDPIPILPVFAITGFILVLLYRLSDIFRRVSRQ